MKTLLLMRHAKSSWGETSTGDHDRPLNDRGIRIAPAMSHFLKQQHVIPTRIVSSSATRAQQTAHAVAQILGTDVVTEADLYLTTHFEWAQILERYQEDEIILSIGHNPAIESFVAYVTKESHRMPTAAIACFDVRESSADLIERLDLKNIWRPKEVLA